MSELLQAGILGAGRMGQGFDSPGDRHILSLAHGVTRSDRLALGGFYDLDPARAAEAEAKWSCVATSRDRDEWLAQGWDALLIATPTACHSSDLRDALARKPKVVVIEKPLSEDFEEAIALLEHAGREDVPVLVDFPRRWAPGVAAITEQLEAGHTGAIRQVVGTCSGGLIHNGVHLLDLVAGWLGEEAEARHLASSGATHFFQVAGSGPDIELVLREAAVENGYLWELEVVAERALWRLGGCPEEVSLWKAGPHPNFPDFSAFREVERWTMDDQPLLPRMLDHAADLATGQISPEAHLKMEIARQRFCANLFAQLR